MGIIETLLLNIHIYMQLVLFYNVCIRVLFSHFFFFSYMCLNVIKKKKVASTSKLTLHKKTKSKKNKTIFHLFNFSFFFLSH